VEISNQIDWQSKGVSLKAAFPLTVSNENVTYNLGVGTLDRGNNMERKYEVPSKEWFDLTDKSGKYGVTIMEDCRYGSDKPADNILRLTLLYTPIADAFDGDMIFQSTQDWGVHDFRYGIYGHNGDWRKGQSQWQARFFNNPLLAFEAPTHEGTLGKSVSFLKINNSAVGVMAFKKMEEGGYYLLRVNELLGKDQKGLSISFPGKVIDAYEVNGQEERIGDADFAKGTLNFDISHYTIKSFAVRFESPEKTIGKPQQVFVELPYNTDVFSKDHNRSDGSFDRSSSYPAELIPANLESESIHFKMGNTEDEQNNAVNCIGQEIQLPQGNYRKLYILASAIGDVQYHISVAGKSYPLNVQNGYGYIGQHYNRILDTDRFHVNSIEKPFSKQDNIAWFASHRHIGYPSKNDAYQYCYIFKYEVDLPEGAKTITLPNNRNIKIFAMTMVNNSFDDNKPLQPLYDDLKNSLPVKVRDKVMQGPVVSATGKQ
jgi:alpha-mannosidase